MRQLDLGPCDAILYGEKRRCWAVVLPGAGYTTQAPLLWFAREVALARGWGALEIRERGASAGDSLTWARDRAERGLAAVGGSGALLIGKSRSSLAAPVAVEHGLPAIWLTPLLGQRPVVAALERATRPTLLVGSTGDPTWEARALPENDLLQVLELEGLDHSLQRAGDPFGSLEVLRRVSERVERFLSQLT